MEQPQPPDFKAIHARAAELVKNDPILAYAVTKALRKAVTGNKSEDTKFALLCHVLGDAWNNFVELNQRQSNHSSQEYTETFVQIAADHLIVAYDILTEKVTHNAPIHTGPRK